MKKIPIKPLVACTILLGLACGCKKDKDQVKLPPPVLNSPELITSMTLRFTDSSNVALWVSAEYRDPDGPGGSQAIKYDTIKLSSGKTYMVDLILLDETKNPVDSVSEEIREERNDHQFFFTHTGVNLSTSYLDSDSNGLPVGLSTKWRTGSSGNGTSRIRLKHQAGTKNGTDGPGETDIDVTFQTKIN